MKVRKLAVALALAGGLGSGVAQALGLGEIELQSYLNEPLDADINLRKSEGVSPGDVFVNIAPQSAFERVGIDRSFFLTKLDFDVTTAPDGSLVVNVSSREPLREPYLNFLLEVTWPNGRLMREYAVLVDPPVYAEESGVEEQVSAPATTTAQPAEPRVRQQTQTQSRQDTRQSGSSGSRTLGPTNSADTLWTIAAQVRPNSDVSMQQVMLALQDLNPDAFIAGNINRLKRGEILRIPDENQIRSRSRAEANREVAAQNQSFNSPQRTVDATGQSADGQSEQVSGSNGGDQLRLLAADDSGQRDADEGGSAGGDGDTAGGVDAGSAVAMEELESARRENEELSGRVDDLQDQVETLQRLLELKNSQLAEIQGAQGESPDMNGEPVAPADEASAEAGEDGEPSAQTEEEPSAENGEPSAENGEPSAESEGPSAESEEPSAETEESSVESEEPPAETEAEEPSSDMADVSDAAPAEDVTEEESAAQQPEAAEPVAAEESAPPQKPFPGNIIDAISNNFMYQIALGGGLIVLLLLLLLLARRNANREKAFYDQLNNDGQGEEGDSFDLTFDEEEGAVDPEDDAIAEADAYIAYGRNDQAAQTLETAISREPSRTDLRLKLLGVYADIQDRESFDKQFREIEALDDEAATAEAQNLQSRLEESESMPSIDDLESQLRSSGAEDESDADKGSVEEAMSFESDYTDYETNADDRLPEDDEPDFGDLDLDEADTTSSLDDLETEKAGDSEATDRDGLIEYDLSELETEEE
jgi:pilus assembly protein FimV